MAPGIVARLSTDTTKSGSLSSWFSIGVSGVLFRLLCGQCGGVLADISWLRNTRQWANNISGGSRAVLPDIVIEIPLPFWSESSRMGDSRKVSSNWSPLILEHLKLHLTAIPIQFQLYCIR